ncbi:MAG TPA: hypothetical protein VIT45_12920 [Allosphingosinicella sp.]
MGRAGTSARFLIASAAALLTAGAARAPTLELRELNWVAPQAAFRSLSRQPRECFAPPDGREARVSAATGRAAFKAPLLLGGQAARAGLSCASCHRNGRGNPDFLFPGLSGAAGTADVTSSIMSKHRGDGTVNPRPIPDLAGPPSKRIVSRARDSRALEGFIRGLIVEEFDGPEPAPFILDGLAAYVRGISAEACGEGEVPVTLAGKLDEAREAVALSLDADRETKRLLIAAARSTLGEIDERFRLPGLERSRSILHEADSELRAIRDGNGSAQAWLGRWPERRRRLIVEGKRSLYAPAILRRALARS